MRVPPRKTTAASGTSQTPPPQVQLSILEREINSGTRHAEVIFRTVDKVPAEITDPTDVRSDTDFQAAADLADSLARRTCMTSCHDLVEAFSRFSDKHILRPLAAAKDHAASAKNVRRKARAVEWV